MKRFYFVAATLAVTSAAYAMTDATTTMNYDGKRMTVHVIKMDDGSTLYGLSKAQLEEIARRNADSMFTSNPQ